MNDMTKNSFDMSQNLLGRSIQAAVLGMRRYGHPNITLPAAAAIGALMVAPRIRRMVQSRLQKRRPGFRINPRIDYIPALLGWAALRKVQGLSILPMMKHSSWDMPGEIKDMSQATSYQMIEMDPTLGIVDRINAKRFINSAAAPNSGGMFGKSDLVRAAVGAGLGGVGAWAVGKTLGKFFGMSPKAQRVLTGAGVLGGILKNTGVI